MRERKDEGKKHNSDLNKNRIEIAYAIHDYYGTYYEYLGVSLVSVMENTKAALNFHVLCDATLTAAAREQLTKICQSYDQQIFFLRYCAG